MIIETISGIQQLTEKEKVILAVELWESTKAYEMDWPVSQEIMQELDRRWKEFEKDPNQGSSWEEVRERLSQRIKK